MGVKSTVNLGRDAAEARYVELRLAKELPALKRLLKSQAVVLTNKDLEAELETLNDEVASGEGFENYIVSGGD